MVNESRKINRKFYYLEKKNDIQVVNDELSVFVLNLQLA